MKKILLVSAVIFALAFAIPAIATPQVPADGLKMDKTKKVVVFNHSTHKALKCVQCHHQVNGEESFKKCGDAGCHDNMDRQDKSAKSYYRAFHGKDTQHASCLTCHREIATKNPEKKAEITGCKGSKCHPAQ